MILSVEVGNISETDKIRLMDNIIIHRRVENEDIADVYEHFKVGYNYCASKTFVDELKLCDTCKVAMRKLLENYL